MSRRGSKQDKKFKQIKKDTSITEPELPTPEVIDVYEDIRHKRLPNVPTQAVFTPRIRKVDVYREMNKSSMKLFPKSQVKKVRKDSSSNPQRPSATMTRRRRSTRGSVYLAHDFIRLNASVVVPEIPKVWTTPVDIFTAPKIIEAISKPEKEKRIYRAQIDASETKESNCLQLYKKTNQDQLKMENACMKMTGKDRESLLLRRQMVLPHISQKSMEKTVIPIERFETPDIFPGDALFAPSIYGIREKNGITVQMTKRQQGHKAVTDWMGCPEVTDEIRNQLGLNEGHILSSLQQNEDEVVRSRQTGSQYLPAFPRLGVLGFNYERLQENLRLPLSETIRLNKHSKDSVIKDFQGTILSDANLQNVVGGNITVPSRVRLSLAHVNLSWSTSQQSAKKKWVVELGCSAEIHQKAFDWVLMKNTGTSAIHYSWVKKHRKNEFNEERSDQTRLVFDSWGGTILPGEVYRIPFMYKAVTNGHYSEEWKLFTQPVLENGAEVILRLWGFTRKYTDTAFRSTWEEIEEKMKANIKLAVVRHRVGKIIDFLPLSETALADTRYPLILLGPDLFASNNPFLHYNSSSVYRLGKISELIERELEKRRNPIMDCFQDSEEEGEWEEDGEYLESFEIENNEIDNMISKSESRAIDSTLLSESTTSARGSLTDIITETIKQISKEIDFRFPRVKSSTQKASYVTKTDEDADETNMDIKQTNSQEESKSTCKLTQSASYVNIINPDISVHSIRQQLLQCSNDLVKQEALFSLMSGEISSMLFTPFLPINNWKIPVCVGVLKKAIEEFTDYAISLRGVCYHAEYIYQSQVHQSEGSKNHLDFDSDRDISSKTTTNANNLAEDDEPSASRKNLRESADGIANDNIVTSDLGFLEECPGSNPRNVLSSERYQGHYYACLYTRMYWLLSDFFDQMDTFLWQPQTLDHYGKEVSIKIDKAPLYVNIKHELEKPLPPKWIRIAERIDKTVKTLRRRAEEIEEREIQDTAASTTVVTTTKQNKLP